MKELISMTDFILDLRCGINPFSEIDVFTWHNRIIDYATFLKRHLELGMFIPCDEEGNVLDMPTGYGCYNPDNPLPDEYYIEHKKYQEAKERVLFEGYTLINEGKNYSSVSMIIKENGKDRGINRIDIFYKNPKTIEDLIPLGLELTETAIKQLGL